MENMDLVGDEDGDDQTMTDANGDFKYGFGSSSSSSSSSGTMYDNRQGRSSMSLDLTEDEVNDTPMSRKSMFSGKMRMPVERFKVIHQQGTQQPLQFALSSDLGQFGTISLKAAENNASELKRMLAPSVPRGMSGSSGQNMAALLLKNMGEPEPVAQPRICLIDEIDPPQSPISIRVYQDKKEYKMRRDQNLPSDALLAPMGERRAHDIEPHDLVFEVVGDQPNIKTMKTFHDRGKTGIHHGNPTVKITATCNGLRRDQRLNFIGVYHGLPCKGTEEGQRNDGGTYVQSVMNAPHTGPNLIRPGKYIAFSELPYAMVARNGQTVPVVQVKGQSPTKHVPRTFEMQTVNSHTIVRFVRAAIRRKFPGTGSIQNLDQVRDGIKDIMQSVTDSLLGGDPREQSFHPIAFYAKWATWRHCWFHHILPHLFGRMGQPDQVKLLLQNLQTYIGTIVGEEAALSSYDKDIDPLKNVADPKWEELLSSMKTMPNSIRTPDLCAQFFTDFGDFLEDRTDINLQRIHLNLSEKVLGKSIAHTISGGIMRFVGNYRALH